VVQGLKLSQHPEFLPQPGSHFRTWKSKIPSSLKSKIRSFLSNVARSLGLSSSSNQNTLAKKSASTPDPLEEEMDTPLVNQLLGGLRIDPIKESRLVRIHFYASTPDLAAKVPNALADEYIQLTLESRVNTTERAKEWLNKQLEEMKAKVEKADEDLQEFGSKYNILSTDEKENITMNRLNELNEALAKAESERMTKEALYKQVKGQNTESLPAMLENKLIQDLKQSFIQLEAQYTKLSETYRTSHPEMIRLKNQMETIQSRLNIELSKMSAGIRNEYEASVRKEALLRSSFEQEKVKATEMQQKAIQYNILKREADTNKDLYKSLLQRTKEVGVSASLQASNIQIVDRAEVPKGPHQPDKRRTLYLAAVIGLFLGVGLAFFLEYLDNTIKSPDEVEDLIHLPSFGLVPEISYERKHLGLDPTYPVERVAHCHPKSILSEAYRNIRTSILLSTPESPPKNIIITSANPLEGKTTTLINTSITLSQTGAQVLIIDADLRKPRVHTVLNTEMNRGSGRGNGKGKGLSSFLSGNSSLWGVVKTTDIPNLYFIPAGAIPPNPSELLGSNLFKEMIQALGEKFDHIVIDTPPVIGFADSVILSTLVDGVVLVVRGGKTPKEALQRAKDSLLQVNARILGVVVNGVNIRQSEYNGYYSRYQYYHQEKRIRELPYHTNRRRTSA
jgi:capsular exopolysaccharide synthesis family protein